MKIKSLFKLSHPSLWSGIGSGMRYILAVTLTGLSIGLFGLSAYLVNTPVTTQKEINLSAERWTVQNCENRLKENEIPYNRDGNTVSILFNIENDSLSRDDLSHGDLAILACPGMEIEKTCIGRQCDPSAMHMEPSVGAR